MNKIFLVGMPGSGKSTLGKRLAEELALPFIDLDREIEAQEALSIPDIFMEKGQYYFRDVESALLKKWATSNQSFVMATGGGAPCFHNGVDVMNQNGTTVYLDTTLDVLVERTKRASNRPLLQAENETELRTRLEKLLAERDPVYRKAQLILREPTVQDVIKSLRR